MPGTSKPAVFYLAFAQWSALVWEGTPDNGTLVGEISSDGLIFPHLDLPAVREDTDELVTRAEGAGLRELHSLLLELDPAKSWGGLKRVLTPAGDYLWLCPEHYREYEPGLPKLD